MRSATDRAEARRSANERAKERHHKAADGEWEAWAKRVCAPEINKAARFVAFAVRDVVRAGPADRREPQDEKIWEAISPSRRDFLDVVRDHLQ